MEEIAGEFHRRIWTSDVFSAMGEGIAQAMYNKKDIDAALRQMEEALCSFQKKENDGLIKKAFRAESFFY